MPAQKRSFVDNPSNSDDDNDQNRRRRREEREDDEEEDDEEDEDEEQESEQNGTSPLQNGHQYKQQHQDEAAVAAEHDKQEDGDEDEEEEEEPHRVEDEEEDDEDDDVKEQTQDSEDNESSSEQGEKPEFVFVELSDIRKDVQCPICLGIIKKTRTVMECLHRFCRECIDKSMRLGNNECPACRTHCASRRSLRDDPNYDALIAALYPDIEKYEEEELAFHEEERTRNKQIQASIAQIFQRQSEALVRRRTMGKETTCQFMTRSQRNHRASRRRRNSRGAEFQGSEDNEDENDDNGGKDSSSTDERSTEVRQRRRKRRPGIRPSQPPSSAVNQDGGCNENDIEASRESRGISPGLVWSTEMLAWGRGGTRSHTRHGNSSGGNNKNSRNTRLSRLVEYLRSLEEKNDELDVHLMLISLDQKSAPSLQQPYLCCRPSLLVRHLREYIAHQMHLQAEAVEIMLVKGQHNPDKNLSTLPPPFSTDELQVLEGQETLAWLKANSSSSREHLILAYRWMEAS